MLGEDLLDLGNRRFVSRSAELAALVDLKEHESLIKAGSF